MFSLAFINCGRQGRRENEVCVRVVWWCGGGGVLPLPQLQEEKKTTTGTDAEGEDAVKAISTLILTRDGSCRQPCVTIDSFQ